MKTQLPPEIQAFSEAQPEVGPYPAQARAMARARLLLATSAAVADLAGVADAAGTAGARAGRVWSVRDRVLWEAGRAWRGLASVFRARPRRRVRWVALTGTAAAATATALTLALLPSSSPAPRHGRPPASRSGGGNGIPGFSNSAASRLPVLAPGSHASLAAILRSAATTAARQPTGIIPGPGQFLYLRDIEMKGGGTRLQLCNTLAGQEWMAADRSGHQTGTYLPGCGGNFKQSWPAGRIKPGFIGWPMDLLAWEGLPTNPQALARVIKQRYVVPQFADMFTATAELLELDAPPALRAALFKVLQTLPGVKNLGPATDPLGRHGIAVGVSSHGIRTELIFDKKTSRALELASIAVPPKQLDNNYLPAGTVTDFDVYVSIGVVNSGTATNPPQAASS